MAAVVRRSFSRRVPYERLRERLWESQLPFDDAAERAAIGAVLLAPNEWQRKLSVKLYSGHFYDGGHGWLWEEMGMALVKNKSLLGTGNEIHDWLERERILPRFKEQFLGSAGKEITMCVKDCFWWHGRWYAERVLVAAKLRAEVKGAAERFGKALAASEQWSRR